MTFDKTKYSLNPDLDFHDITNEACRTYFYPPPREDLPLTEMRIENPEAVSFKAPNSYVAGGSHRIVTKDGKGYYIPAGWVGIEWEWATKDRLYQW
jgi:hypothetical protein